MQPLNARAGRRLWIGLGATIALASCAANGGGSVAATNASAPLPKCDPAVTARDIEACVRFLASDDLAGRATGSEGSVRAAKYLSEGLARAGVKPAGDDGTYLQRVPMQQTDYSTVPAMRVWNAAGEETALVYGIDFQSLSGVPPTARLNVHVARSLEQMPKEADANGALLIDASYGSSREWLDKAGYPRGAGWGLLLYRGGDRPGTAPVTTPPRSRRETVAEGVRPPPSVRVLGALLQRLRDGQVASLELVCESKCELVPAFNVVGRIDGCGLPKAPEFANQAIVFSAHYDHLGVDTRTPADGSVPADTIFNGADDDASGCAALLEVAEALGADKPPARTLIFFFATGEEVGLLGTDWYVEHPFVPLAKTVCNLNFEMIGRPDPMVGGPGNMWLTGYERSNLGPEFGKAGLAIVLDPRPDQHFFERSDNIAFANKGIVAQTLSTYNLHTDYHHVSDEADTLDYQHMETCVRACVECARLLATAAVEPTWNPGGAPKTRGDTSP